MNLIDRLLVIHGNNGGPRGSSDRVGGRTRSRAKHKIHLTDVYALRVGEVNRVARRAIETGVSVAGDSDDLAVKTSRRTEQELKVLADRRFMGEVSARHALIDQNCNRAARTIG